MNEWMQEKCGLEFGRVDEIDRHNTINRTKCTFLVDAAH